MLLCSTGTFVGRPNGRNHRLILENAPHLHCDGFEFMMYENWYEKQNLILSDLVSSGLSFPVVHVDKLVGELISRGQEGDIETALSNFERNCAVAQALGAKLLVLHLWNGKPSDAHIERNIAQFAALNSMAKAHHLMLTVENVVCNCRDPLTHWHALAHHYPDIHFTFDTKMAAFHSQLEQHYCPELTWLWQNGRIVHLHVNDYGGGHMDWANLRTLHPGQGHIDFDRFFAYIKSVGYCGHITAEASSMLPDGSTDLATLNQTLDFLRCHIA